MGREAGRNYSYIRLSMGGSTATAILDAASTRRRQFYPFGSVFFLLVGTNDVRDPIALYTAQQVLDKAVAIAKELFTGGAKQVWIMTLPPDTSGTNRNAVRVAYNDLLRSEPNPFTGVLDLADVLETSRNSNTWKTGYNNADGYHMNATGGAAARDWLRALMFSQR
jgi:lysophospholipase L1-like esterase